MRSIPAAAHGHCTIWVSPECKEGTSQGQAEDGQQKNGQKFTQCDD